MAGKYDVNQVMELLFDDEFGLSHGTSKEEVKDTSATEENCSTKKLVEDFGSKLASNSSGFSLDE